MHRIGQTSDVLTRTYYIRDTIEERILAWRGIGVNAVQSSDGDLTVLADDPSKSVGKISLEFCAYVFLCERVCVRVTCKESLRSSFSNNRYSLGVQNVRAESMFEDSEVEVIDSPVAAPRGGGRQRQQARGRRRSSAAGAGRGGASRNPNGRARSDDDGSGLDDDDDE